MSAALNAQEMYPSLTTNDLRKSIAFYEGLGFEVVHRHETEGVLQFVSMKGGGAQVGLGQDDFAKGRDRLKGIGARFWITTTQDITALAEGAKKAGIKLDEGPAPLPWGPMAFAVTDPDGFKITVTTPM
jgi:catechol 2,3-dioxygenase-like lactoylglutathione lyase family enzyme